MNYIQCIISLYLYMLNHMNKLVNERRIDMDKITEKQKAIITHSIYCDKCGKFLDEVEEYDDGCIPNHWEHTENWYINGKWMCFKSNLCDDCKRKFIDTLITTLLDLGFKLDN